MNDFVSIMGYEPYYRINPMGEIIASMVGDDKDIIEFYRVVLTDYYLSLLPNKDDGKLPKGTRQSSNPIVKAERLAFIVGYNAAIEEMKKIIEDKDA